jgi:multiple sugar transport system permease protein
MVLPSMLFLLLLNAYPVVYAGAQSVRNGSLLAAGDFVGLLNYKNILSNEQFWDAAAFTLLFVVAGVFVSWAVGLGLAMIIHAGVPGAGVFRVLLLLPWIVPIVVSSTAWNWLLATPQSPIPTLVRALGGGDVRFLADPTLAIVTLCFFKVWATFPFMMLMASAALASVDGSTYEAAQMDGASRWQVFTQITLPLIARPTFISWILVLIFSVNDFPTVFLLTGGGPVNATTTLVVLAYHTVFQNFHTGPGTAIAFLMTITLIVISVALYRLVRKARIE